MHVKCPPICLEPKVLMIMPGLLFIGLNDDVIKWKHFPRYRSIVWGIHRWPVNFPHKGQWRGALMFSLITTGTNGWVNTRYVVDLSRHCAHYDVTVIGIMLWLCATHQCRDEEGDCSLRTAGHGRGRLGGTFFMEDVLSWLQVCNIITITWLIPGLGPANERRRNFVTTSLIGWVQA